MDKMQLAVFLCASFCFVAAKQVRFKDCGSHLGKIEELDVTPCDVEPCIFKRGGNETLTVTFTLNTEVQAAEAKAIGIFGKLQIPFPLPHADCCKYGLTCPLKPGVTEVYSISVPIKSLYPQVSLVVKLELVSEKKEMIICLEIPVKIR